MNGKLRRARGGFILTATLLAPLAVGAAEKSADKPAPAVSIDWVKLPAGSYQMGSSQWSDTRPVHKVSVKPFEMAKTPVTNKQYRACVEAGACTPIKACDGYRAGENVPATCVSWEQAKAFAKWVGGRLPTDSEWEYAARDLGRSSKYPWGNDRVTPREVCTNAKATTPQGLCDMSTVWEWVEDWYHPGYAGAPADGSAWEDAGWDRVYVGGGFYFRDKDGKLVTPCRRLDPSTRRAELGFRIVKG
ncbi:MAG: formylglycine-generating enzyme family protein [Elusimicrobiota bacterium]